MTPEEVTPKDIYENVTALRIELTNKIDEFIRTTHEHRLNCEKRFAEIEGEHKSLSTRVYYAFAGLVILGGLVLSKFLGWT